jgi:hypothetical protein
MKVKLIDIYSSVGSLNKLIDEPLPAKISFKLMKLLNQLNQEVKLIEDQRTKLIKKFAGEEGNTVKDENKDQFIKELTEILEESVDISWEPVSIDALGDIKMSVLELSKVQYLFVE